MKKFALGLICFFSVLAILGAVFILIVTERVNIFWYGFGVDTNEQIYIGSSSKILVYKDKSLYNTILVPPCRSYRFIIQEDNTILLSTPNFIYIMDLNGNILSQESDSGAHVYSKLQRTKQFTTENGNQYRRITRFGRTCIIRNDEEIVYQMPFFDFSVRIVLFFSVISFIIFIPNLAFQIKRVYGIGMTPGINNTKSIK